MDYSPRLDNNMKINKELSAITKPGKQEKQKANKVATPKSIRRKESRAWGCMAKRKKYVNAVTRDFCCSVTSELIEECLDGVCLNLSMSNRMKSDRVQKRILRRIVEKRQAQAFHNRVKGAHGLYASHIEKNCCSNCMERIQQHRYSA